ncbi:M10 family metallopeptidase C-terminal domain-containing protein [Rhizobium alvei]|uniref:M10 family metallopeptidase C-terminal domain-containing protein n=1 Tax=Rhizobium alvei TaxID=1132659 RepID=A0ABT8YRU5_9HYPH|nr:M10 family metallopeptidase C-terminal domain-containing protein [Rhizobium alvei]MDO6966332.1 M10 family metallopeptidase C-terminal domain-containing protein [Rhizobium alvei]
MNHVTITDFVKGADKIDLHEFNNLYFIDTLAEVKALPHNDGDNLVFDFSSLQDHTTFTLLGIHKAELSAGDFIFV